MLHSSGGDERMQKVFKMEIELDASLYKGLRKLAEQEKTPLSLTVKNLIKEALDIYEDIYSLYPIRQDS